MEGYREFHPYPCHGVPPLRYSRDPYPPMQLPPQSVPRIRRNLSEEYIPNLPQPLYPPLRYPYPDYQHYAPQGYSAQPPPLGINGFGIARGHVMGNAQQGYHPHQEAYSGRAGPSASIHYQTHQYHAHAYGGGVPMRGNAFGVPSQPPPPHGFGYGQQPAFVATPQATREPSQST